jgi:hypothetical protein
MIGSAIDFIFLNLMPRPARGVDKFWNNGYGRFGASKQFSSLYIDRTPPDERSKE